MISDKIAKALNEQINEELYSAYLYLSMAAYFESLNLSGCAAWMQAQTREENGHAMKIFGFIHARRGQVTLAAIKEPIAEWKSPLAAFEAAFKHEQHITGKINGLVDLAIEEKDHATADFLQWFVKEQVEEEASVDRIVQQLKMAANAPGAMLMLDHVLGERK